MRAGSSSVRSVRSEKRFAYQSVCASSTWHCIDRPGSRLLRPRQRTRAINGPDRGSLHSRRLITRSMISPPALPNSSSLLRRDSQILCHNFGGQFVSSPRESREAHAMPNWVHVSSSAADKTCLGQTFGHDEIYFDCPTGIDKLAPGNWTREPVRLGNNT